MTTNQTIPTCGIADSGEEAYCVKHAAVILDVTVHQLHYAAKVGKVDLWPAARPLTCGTRRRSNCLVQVGDLL